jgi:hypothetical protein
MHHSIFLVNIGILPEKIKNKYRSSIECLLEGQYNLPRYKIFDQESA